MSADPPRPHRPVPYADLTELIDAAGGEMPYARAELAAATAAVVVGAGRGTMPEGYPDAAAGAEGLVGLADTVGIDTLAALWRDAEPVSLAGTLWVLYLLRQWCRSQPAEVARLWRAGEGYAPADSVVAGVGLYGDADAVRQLADAVLAGAYRGDFAVALERAAAFFRVIAAGRRESLPTDGAAGTGDEDAGALELAARNDRAARDLAAGARAWRAGTLR